MHWYPFKLNPAVAGCVFERSTRRGGGHRETDGKLHRGEIFFQKPASEFAPSVRLGSTAQQSQAGFVERRCGFGELGFDSVAFGETVVDADARLSGVSGLSGDASEEFGPGGDGLAVFFAVDKSGVETPPVADVVYQLSGGHLA